jgi:hypothetical protein
MSTGEPLDLDAVRERADRFIRAKRLGTAGHGPYGAPAAAWNSAEDVPALLSEVEDLRSANEWLRGAADALSAERDRLRDELGTALEQLHINRGES